MSTRLRETNPSVVGVLISASGFGEGAVKRVERNRERPVLLVSGDELEAVLRTPELLRRKLKELMIHARPFATASGRMSDVSRTGVLPVDQVSFLINGRREPMLTSGGGFGRFVFVQNMPDIDWTAGGGTGVHMDMSFTPGTAEGLIDVMQRLVDAGWATGRGRWSIQQASQNWHGAGSRRSWRLYAAGVSATTGSDRSITEEVC